MGCVPLVDRIGSLDVSFFLGDCMKRIFSALLFLACSAANAQFVQGQILTAAQLNAAFANVLATSGGTLTGPLTVQGNTVVNNLTVNGIFTAPGALSPSSLAPQIPNSVIGNVSSNTQSPGVVGLPSCASNTNALIYTNGAGFTCNTNINASTLGGQIFAAPGPIGSSVASSGVFTTLIASSGINSTAIGATTASTGAFTTLSASSTVSGTGFSTYLGSPPAIGTTTPASGAFTSLGATGLITPQPTIGIKGTTTNDSPAAGSIGEFVSSLTGSAVTLTTTVVANITSISLTAGDWDVSGNIQFLPAGTGGTYAASISTTSATRPSWQQESLLIVSEGAASAKQMPTPVVRISISTTTIVYLVGYAGFSSTMTANGFIRARRVR